MSRVQVIDVFCGGGGFSQGASDAGCEVIAAVDCWDEALEVHALNHGDTAHLKINCGEVSPADVVAQLEPLIDRSRPLHLHCSPPCQQLTNANRINPDVEVGLNLVKWSVGLKESLMPDSFTMEQVNHPALKRYLVEQNLVFELVKMWKHGVPQGRKRIIVTDPPVFPLPEVDTEPSMAHTIGLPRGLEHRSSNARLVKTCDGIGYTVTSLCTRVRTPAAKEGEEPGPWRTLTFPEMLLFQTFPSSYDLGERQTIVKRKIIGNAVPPLMAKVIMDEFQKSKVYSH